MASPFANIHVSPEMIPHRHHLPRERTLYHNDILIPQDNPMPPIVLRDDGTVWGPATPSANHIYQYGITDVVDIAVRYVSSTDMILICLRNDGNVYVSRNVEISQAAVATQFYGPNFQQFYRIPELTNVLAFGKSSNSNGRIVILFNDEDNNYSMAEIVVSSTAISKSQTWMYTNLTDVYTTTRLHVQFTESGMLEFYASYARDTATQYLSGAPSDEVKDSDVRLFTTAYACQRSVNLDIIQVTGGTTFTAYLSRNGKVYVCGDAATGTIPSVGGGTHCTFTEPFYELPLPSGKFVVSIGSSNDSLFILCSDGTAYATGSNSSWTQISDLENIVRIAGNQYVWCAITGDGLVWVKATAAGNVSSKYYLLGRGATPGNYTTWYPLVIDYRDLKVPYGMNSTRDYNNYGVTAKGNCTKYPTEKKLSFLSAYYAVTREGELYIQNASSAYVNDDDVLCAHDTNYKRHKTLSGVKTIGFGITDITSANIVYNTVVMFNGESYTLAKNGAATKTTITKVISTSCLENKNSHPIIYTFTDVDGKVWSHTSSYGLVNGSSTVITEAAYQESFQDVWGNHVYYYVKYNGDIYVAGDNDPDKNGESRMCGVIGKASTSISTPVRHSNIKDTKEIGFAYDLKWIKRSTGQLVYVYNDQEIVEHEYQDAIWGKTVLQNYNNALIATNSGIGYITTTGDLMILTPGQTYTDTTIRLLPSKISAYKRFTHDPILTGIVATSRSFQIGGSMFLRYDGTLYGIRAVSYQNTGEPTNTQYYVHECATNVRDFDICATHGIIVKNDGKVYTSGYNNRGMLGQGNTTTLTTWTQVSGVNAHKVACCDNHSYIMPSSYLLACGYNNTGACGLGTTTQTTSFTNCKDGDENVYADYLCATTNNCFIIYNNKVYACGANANSSGRIQGHATVNVKTFSQICTEAVKPVSISLNATASIILEDDGSWWFSGTNTNGLAGYNNGTTNQNTYYHSTAKTDLKFMDIKLGTGVSIAIDKDGYIYTAGAGTATGSGTLNSTANVTLFTQADFPRSASQGTRHNISDIIDQTYQCLPDDLRSIIDSSVGALSSLKDYNYNDREKGIDNFYVKMFIPSLKEVAGPNTTWLHPLENDSKYSTQFAYFKTLTNFSGSGAALTRSKPSKEYLNADINLYVSNGTVYAASNDALITKCVKPCFVLG